MEKRLWACPKVPFQGHHQEISRSDQESWALRIFVQTFGTVVAHAAWIFPTCFNTNSILIQNLKWQCLDMSWFCSFQIHMIFGEGGHHAPKRFWFVESCPYPFGPCTCYFLEARGFFQTANGIIWPTRPVVKRSDYFEMNLVTSTEKHPDFPFLLGTISMYQWMKCTPPMKTKE